MVRHILIQMLGAFFALVCTPFSGHAEYPDRPLKIIVAWPPGGVVDTTARIVGEQLAVQLGQPVVVENRVGANGNIGTTAAARAPADGYTLQAVTAETHAINPHLYKALTYNVSGDFEPVALLSRSNFVLAAKASATDVEGFGIVYVEANASGVPVLCSRSGGAVDAVRHGETGILIEGADPEGIAEGIRVFRNSSHSFDPVRIASYAENFRWRSVVGKVETTLRTIAGEHPQTNAHRPNPMRVQ